MQGPARVRRSKVYLGAVVLGATLACRTAGPAPSSSAVNAPAIGSDNAPLAQSCQPNAPTFESAADSTEVDLPTRPRSGGPYPQYPHDLRERSIRGMVRILFVVDTVGRAEMCTARVVDSTHPLFLHAVLRVLPRMRFFPAVWDGRKVRQRAEMRWEFRIGPSIVSP